MTLHMPLARRLRDKYSKGGRAWMVYKDKRGRIRMLRSWGYICPLRVYIGVLRRFLLYSGFRDMIRLGGKIDFMLVRLKPRFATWVVFYTTRPLQRTCNGAGNND
jgi:hypothetical protein